MPQLKIEILDIEPESVYKNVVYDQTIVARLQDGTKMELFDSTAVANDDMVGDVLNVSVSILTGIDVRKISGKTIGINPCENPSTKWSYEFVGKITEDASEDGPILFNVGVGTVSIEPHSNDITQLIEESSVGDQLCIPDGRADLAKIK